jgi:hypothetical protein
VSTSLIDALEVVEAWRAGGSRALEPGETRSTASGNAPAPRQRTRTTKPVSEMTEEEIVAMNQRALAAVAAKWSGFTVG